MSGVGTKGVWLEDLTWPEAEKWIKGGATVIIPIGARSKEHGHHLPLKTDYMLARALADGIARELPVLIAPVVDFGYYPAFVEYPGSQHLRVEVFVAVLEDIIDGFIRQGVKSIAVVNTGVSTEAPIYIAARNTYAKHAIRVMVADIRNLGKSAEHVLDQKYGGHADELETALVLAIDSSTVDMTKAVPDYGNMLDQPKTVFYRPIIFRNDPSLGIDYSATGCRGDPSLATVEKGKAILDAMVADLVAGLRALEGA